MLVVIFVFVLFEPGVAVVGELSWREVKFPEYRNSISGYFHLKRATLISICRGLGGVSKISEPDSRDQK